MNSSYYYDNTTHHNYYIYTEYESLQEFLYYEYSTWTTDSLNLCVMPLALSVALVLNLFGAYTLQKGGKTTFKHNKLLYLFLKVEMCAQVLHPFSQFPSTCVHHVVSFPRSATRRSVICM